MNLNFGSRSRIKLVSKVLVTLSIFFIIFLLLNYFYLKWISYEKIKNNVKKNVGLILSDIKYSEGKWDTTLYLQDTNTPFDKPLYIFTTEGFVVERMNPITGFLDKSDFNNANSFNSTKTITTPINTNWRIYSQPVKNKDKVEAVILTAYLDPNPQIITEIDNGLIENAQKINSLIEFNNDEISVEKIDPKNISSSVYFAVIDKFNRVLKEDGGPPNFIDRSFIADQLKIQDFRTVYDEKTQEPYLMFSQPITDSDKNPVGVIVHGESLKTLNEILVNQRNFSMASGGVVLLFLSAFITFTFGKEIKPKYINPEKITFDKKYSQIILDKQNLAIDYGSKQYDLCKTLFSHPKKRWEHDELLEKNNMDEDTVSERVFYDAALKINNKVFNKIGIKLIIYKDKTFQINPALLPKIS